MTQFLIDSSKSDKLSHAEFIVAFISTFVLLLILIHRSICAIHIYMLPENTYPGFDISDLMINYQGGFVRRGLIGEILYQVFIVHPFAVHKAVIIMDIIFAIILTSITCVVCVKMKWFPIMPLAILTSSIFWYRRDFLMISMAFLIFWFIFKYVTSKNKKHLVFSVILMNLSVLMYEPSFFFIVPLSALIFWTSLDVPLESRIIKILYVFCSPVITMAAVCLSKGSYNMATAIWNSWNPLFDYIGEQYRPIGIPAGIGFLGRGTDAFKFHLDLNFHFGQSDCLFYVLGSVLMILCCCLLTVYMPSVKSKSIKVKALLLFTFVFQFLCLSPMFSVLSCDFGRTINYVIFTSCFIPYFVTKFDYHFHIPIIESFENFISKVECKVPMINSLWFYLLVLCFMPFNSCMGVSISSPLCRCYFYYVKVIFNLLF